MNKMKNNFPLIVMVIILVFASLACQKAGEILTPPEATARADAYAVQTAAAEVLQVASNAKFKANDTVVYYSEGANVPLYSEAGGTIPLINATAGNNGIIKESVELDGEVWYKVLSTSGNGWVTEAFLRAPGEDAEAHTYEVGDTATLTGLGLMVSLYDQPGSNTIRAQSSRGETVEIMESSEYNGKMWYKVSTSAGDGWLEETFLTVE